MSNNKYALLLDNLFPSETSKSILEEINSKNYDVTIFLLNKHHMMMNPFPVFSIADYFNFKGVTIITSPQTKEKAEAYPNAGLYIILGDNIPNYINISQFNLDLIEQVVNKYYDQHKANDSTRN